MNDRPTAQDYAAAYYAGVAIAKAYKIGDTFLGAWPECDKLGYEPHSLERAAFTAGYCANLARPIVTTRDTNIILQYGPRKEIT